MSVLCIANFSNARVAIHVSDVNAIHASLRSLFFELPIFAGYYIFSYWVTVSQATEDSCNLMFWIKGNDAIAVKEGGRPRRKIFRNTVYKEIMKVLPSEKNSHQWIKKAETYNVWSYYVTRWWVVRSPFSPSSIKSDRCATIIRL